MPGYQPIEQAADGGQVLLDRGGAIPALHLVDVGGHGDRLRIWAVKNSTVRSAACGPARLTVAGRPSICQPPDTTRASGAAATGARAPGCGRPVWARRPLVAARGPSPFFTVP